MNNLYCLRLFFLLTIIYSCSPSTIENECVLIMPDHKITNSFCDSDFKIEFKDSRPLNGASPFTYKWSNGIESFNNASINTPGIYRLSVTDANGCSIVNVYNVENELRLPKIESVSIKEVLCEQSAIKVDVEYFLPVFDIDVVAGFEYEYFDSKKDQMIFRYFKINESGFGKRKLILGPNADPDQIFKITAFAQIGKRGNYKCYGDSELLELPSIPAPQEFSATRIEIKKRDLSNCTPNEGFFLDGYCGSAEGCLIEGGLPLIHRTVPQGMFEIDLPNIAGNKRYSILPLLENNIQCSELDFLANNLEAQRIATHDYNSINLGGVNWSDGEDCNCYLFKIEEIVDSPVTITNSEMSTYGSTVTQIGDFSAKVCIENDGPHCVLVTDQIGCQVEYCNLDLQIRNLEISAINTFKEYVVGKTGDFFASVNNNNAQPVKWNVGDLEEFIISIDDFSLALSSLSKGEYTIEAEDANGCKEVINFEIDDSNLFGFINEFVTYEGISKHLGMMQNSRFLDVAPRFPLIINKQEYKIPDFMFIQEVIKESSTFSWVGPDGFQSNNQRIFPRVTGTYCVEVKTTCGKAFRKCHKYSAHEN